MYYGFRKTESRDIGLPFHYFDGGFIGFDDACTWSKIYSNRPNWSCLDAGSRKCQDMTCHDCQTMLSANNNIMNWKWHVSPDLTTIDAFQALSWGELANFCKKVTICWLILHHDLSKQPYRQSAQIHQAENSRVHPDTRFAEIATEFGRFCFTAYKFFLFFRPRYMRFLFYEI